VYSAVGTMIAVVAITLFLSTAYLSWRVYFKLKYRMPKKNAKEEVKSDLKKDE
jgi:hypothetical protein